MCGEPHLTDGTGVRTAHSIPWSPIKSARQNQILIFAMSATQKKTNKFAQSKLEGIVQLGIFAAFRVCRSLCSS
jgi:hypothetical protein